jgi:murein L,D-transpeptidase YcbB/YkuD
MVGTCASETRRSGGSTSIPTRVINLERFGNTEEANSLRDQFPQLFTTPTAQLQSLQIALSQLLEQYRALTGRDFSASRGNGGATTTPVVPVVDVTGLQVRDLYRGLSGEDVRALQVLLINHNAGPKALELQRVTATGFFANYTEEALIEYQVKYGIAPATGYFGPATRTQMKTAGLEGLWW